MKLLTVKKIKAYKSFQDFTWQIFLNNEPFHDDVNIFYGENGSGKSSICNLLKSVSGHTEFEAYKPTETCLSFSNEEKNYNAITDWDSKIARNSILFFDREFVEKNVHLGHKRDTTQHGQEQESGKMIIEFDSNAIKFRDVRDKARKDKEKQDQEVKNFNEVNRDSLAFRLTEKQEILFKKYMNQSNENTKSVKEELERAKKEIEKNLEKDYALERKGSSIQDDVKDLPKVEVELTFPRYQAYQRIFDFDLKEQVKNVAEQGLIERLRINKPFFDAGFEMRKSQPDKCPFCQTEDKEEEIKKIVELYNQIYDTMYKVQVQKYETDKQSLVDEVSQISQVLSDFDISSIFLELKKLDENYKIPDIYSVEDERAHKKPTDNAIKLLISEILKLSSVNKNNIQEVYTSAESEFRILESFFEKIGNFVDAKNEVITKFKLDNTDEKLQLRITANTERLETMGTELEFINGDFIIKQNRKEEKEKKRQALLDAFTISKTAHDVALKEYEEYSSTNAFSKLLAGIQEYFKEFHFSFKLELKSNPTGNKMESPFAFRVLDSEGNERDFKEGLSEGEVQVLSLCFFFAFLDVQEEKDQKILVFDDPITSLDNSNLGYLVKLIAKMEKSVSQTFIFTHHGTFFKFLRKQFKTDGTKNAQGNEYNIIRNRKEFGGSFICRSKQDKFVDKLQKFETHLASIPPESFDVGLKTVEYGQYLRYEVERYIKNSLLHWNAGDFSTAIDGVKNNKKIDDDDLDVIKGVYSFCNWTTSHVDVGDDHGLGQLKEKVADFVRIAK